MKAFMYGIVLQFRLDIRSKTVLVTCYLVPLIFFFFMSGIFISVDPSAKNTLIPSMSVFVITMSALIGLPPSLIEIYGGEVKKVYKANGVPVYLGIVTQFISSFLHTFIVCLIIFAVAPIAFEAQLPNNLITYFCSLISLLFVTLAIGCVLGLLIKSQAKLTMIAMIIFLPSIMLSGIMFPATMLPEFLQYLAYVFPATIGFKAMTAFEVWHLPVLWAIYAVLCVTIFVIIRLKSRD